MGKFTKILNENYKHHLEIETISDSKMEYLSYVVFGFKTYDSEMDELFVKKMIEVLKSILYGKTYEYIEDKDQYINYLTMVNMPFLSGMLDWGTSIRGAWFNDFEEYDLYCSKIEEGELSNFIKDLIEWAE